MIPYDMNAVGKNLELNWVPGGHYTLYGKFLVCRPHEAEIGKIYAGNFEFHSRIPLDEKSLGRYSIIGAGQFDKNGHITHWFSAGLSLLTPEELRDPLQNIFAQNAEVIAQNWSNGS